MKSLTAEKVDEQREGEVVAKDEVVEKKLGEPE